MLHLRENQLQCLEGIFPVGAFKNTLLQKCLQLRPEGNRFIEHRVAAFGVRPDAYQIAVALEAGEQLFEVTHAGVVLLGDQGRHRTADGLEATRKIARMFVDTKVIMLTVHTENPLPARVMQAGAAGYLSKGAAPQEVVNAIRTVYAGQRYIASDIAQQMALSQIEPEKTESPFASLSERELQIMLMITKGQKVNEISEQLNLSPKTVNSYRYRMFSKLNIHGDVELTHLAIRHGLCNAESLISQ